jgi:hypothetical protein
MARRRSYFKENPRPLWVAGIAGAAVLLVGGIAFAASKSSSGGGCPSGQSYSQHVTDAATAQALLSALGGAPGPGPGVYYGTYQGQPFMYVNNMDGSQSAVSASVPKGSTGFFMCQ